MENLKDKGFYNINFDLVFKEDGTIDNHHLDWDEESTYTLHEPLVKFYSESIKLENIIKPFQNIFEQVQKNSNNEDQFPIYETFGI